MDNAEAHRSGRRDPLYTAQLNVKTHEAHNVAHEVAAQDNSQAAWEEGASVREVTHTLLGPVVFARGSSGMRLAVGNLADSCAAAAIADTPGVVAFAGTLAVAVAVGNPALGAFGR